MAGIDKIYGSTEQYDEFYNWLLENEISMKCRIGFNWDGRTDIDIFDDILPSECLYQRGEYKSNPDARPISNFPEEVNKWLLKVCPLKWVTDRIKEQYGIK